jgi:hypothetical protein
MQFPAASLPKLVEYLAAAGKRGVRYNLVPRYNLHSNTTRESSIMMTKLFTLTNLMFIALLLLLLLLITYYYMMIDFCIAARDLIRLVPSWSPSLSLTPI